MRRLLQIIVLLILATQISYANTGTGYPQNNNIVRNVNSRQEGNKIIITYELTRQADITISFSEDGGRTFTLIRSITGDVGENISPGKKSATWDVLFEVDELTGDNIVFRVNALDNELYKKQQCIAKRKKMQSHLFINILVNYPPTFDFDDFDVYSSCDVGFMVGSVKRFGWYASGLFNISSLSDTDSYSYTDFDDDNLFSSNIDAIYNTVTAGAVFKAFSFLDIYAGPGIFWGELGTYDDDNRFYAFAVDAGIMFNYKLVSLNVGAQFPVYENIKPMIVFGIGLYL